MAMTKVFKSGNSMAVRLPASFNAVPGTPVEVREEQGRWIVESLANAKPKKIDLTGIWGSIPGLKQLTPDERTLEERDLPWHLLNRNG
nr:AbrB/MazE/SpoVT family DNA-binding domain-containing protein [Polymorphobacter sp.]